MATLRRRPLQDEYDILMDEYLKETDILRRENLKKVIFALITSASKVGVSL
jgi:hypothetical protein